MKKLKFAVAGLGRIGRIHLENLLQMSNVEIVAVMDTMEEPRKYAKSKNISFIASSFKEMLVITDFDVVVICSPTHTHSRNQLTIKRPRISRWSAWQNQGQ